jgi:hypothetical protein
MVSKLTTGEILKKTWYLLVAVSFIIGLLFCVTIVGIPIGLVFMFPGLIYLAKISAEQKKLVRIKEMETAIRNSKK